MTGLKHTHYLSIYNGILGKGNGTPLQYSCLENPMDGGAWWAAVHGVATERLPFHFSLSCFGEGNGNPLQCSCLENPRDGGADNQDVLQKMNMAKQWKQWQTLFWGAPKSLQMVTAAMKWKDACSLDQEAFEFLFTFCHKGGVICISEVIDISPSNPDCSLCFIQPGILHDVLCI